MARSKRKLAVYKKAGLTIVFIAIISLILTFYVGGVWILNINFVGNGSKGNAGISGNDFNAEILDVNSIDADSLFANTYFQSLNILSNSISFGTTWLEVCETGQIEIDNEIYVEVCSDKYSSTSDIYDSLSDYISTDYIYELMEENFIDRNGKLYIKPIYIDKNDKYVEFVSYRVAQKTSNKIVYMVKSKYGVLDCGDSCDYSYKEHKFTLIRERNKWVVSNFEMPY